MDSLYPVIRLEVVLSAMNYAIKESLINSNDYHHKKAGNEAQIRFSLTKSNYFVIYIKNMTVRVKNRLDPLSLS